MIRDQIDNPQIDKIEQTRQNRQSNNPLPTKENSFVIKTCPTKKILGPDGVSLVHSIKYEERKKVNPM